MQQSNCATGDGEKDRAHGIQPDQAINQSPRQEHQERGDPGPHELRAKQPGLTATK